VVFYQGSQINLLNAIWLLTLDPGAPYRFDKMIKTHTKFVQDVRYSPSGDVFVSVGSDAKVFLYDGKTGDVTSDLGEGIHSGTIVQSSIWKISRWLLTMFQVCCKLES
jgi:WD40 repeat protein